MRAQVPHSQSHGRQRGPLTQPTQLSDRGVVRLSAEEWTGKNGLRADGRFYVYNDYKGIPTIGIGHKVKAGEDWSKGLSADEVMALFHRDLAPLYRAIANLKYKPSQAAFDALCITAHNCGIGFLMPASCTAIRRLNENDLEGFAPESCNGYCGVHLQDWNRSGDPPVYDANLFARRQRERAWFHEDDPPPNVPPAELFSDWEKRQTMASVYLSLQQSSWEQMDQDRKDRMAEAFGDEPDTDKLPVAADTDKDELAGAPDAEAPSDGRKT